MRARVHRPTRARARAPGWLAPALIGLALGSIACDRGSAAPVAEAPVGEAPVGEAPVEEAQVVGALVEVTAEGLPQLLRSRPGRALLVNVWSTWCEPCVEEMPTLLEVARSYRGRGLELVLISTDAPRQAPAALRFLREQGAPSPAYLKRGSDQDFIAAVHPDWTGALPATVLLDRERRARAFWEEPIEEAALRRAIEALLDGGPAPAP